MSRLYRNTIYNALGTGLPLLGGLIAVPTLVSRLGTDRFGILSLAWVVVGYFSFFDLGIGRAITQLLAKRIGSGDTRGIASLVHTGIALMAVLGLIGGLGMVLAAPWIVRGPLSLPAELEHETIASFRILALSIPFVILGAGWRGVLEGWQRFDVVSLIRGPMGLVTYLGPVVAVLFTDTLPLVMFVLFIGRVLSVLGFRYACIRMHPELRVKVPYDRAETRELLSFGGWLTLSNVIGPLLLYAGRLVLAVAVSVEAVAYFSTPYDVVAATLLIPSTLAAVLFPYFAEQFESGSSGVVSSYSKSVLFTLGVMLPLSILIYVLAEPGLTWWIDAEFAAQSYRVAQILAIGVFANSFGHLAQALVQAYGRPDLTAKLHVAELTLYLPYLWILVKTSEVDGAALAWLIRVVASTIVLAVMAHLCLTGRISSRKPARPHRRKVLDVVS